MNIDLTPFDLAELKSARNKDKIAQLREEFEQLIKSVEISGVWNLLNPHNFDINSINGEYSDFYNQIGFELFLLGHLNSQNKDKSNG